MTIRSAHFVLLALLAYRLLDGSDRGRRIFDLYDQPRVPLVPKPDHDGLLRIMHVPEYPPAFLMEGARRNNPRHVGPSAPDALPPLARDFRIRFGAQHMGEGYLQAAP